MEVCDRNAIFENKQRSSLFQIFVLIYSEISAFIFPGSSVRDRLRAFLLESWPKYQHRELLERSSSSGLHIVFLIVLPKKVY